MSDRWEPYVFSLWVSKNPQRTSCTSTYCHKRN